MGRAARYQTIQRMVTNGDVIYVHQPSARSHPAPAPAPPARDEWPHPVAAAEPAEQVTEATEAVEETESTEGYTAPPPGYAYEFGTGRLVPIRPDLIPAH